LASTDARPVPRKNVAFRCVFPLLDADGDLVTGASGLDSEISKDQGAFADCTNEATEIATSSGVYYLDLTSTEMNADCVAIIVKTSTVGAKTTVLVFYPEEAGDYRADVTHFGGSAGTFARGRPEVNTSHIAGSAVSTSSAQIGVNVVNAGGTAWASGSLTAGVFAADAITAAKVAADVGTEIGTAVWATAARTLTANTNLNDLSAAGVRAALGMASANLDTQLGTLATQASVNTIDDFLDTEVAAIKAKTDSLTFTTAGLVDANVQQINDVTITGDGQVGTEFGV
jgi:hypothetical protein